MKAKNLFHALALVALLVAMIGSAGTAYAQPSLEENPGVIVRERAYFDTTYTGTVDADRFERWSFYFSKEHKFTATATAASGDLVPRVRLLAADGVTELASGEGSFTTTQAGETLYFIQIEPVSGSGEYKLNLTDHPIQGVAVATSPTNIRVGETSIVTASLSGVPAEGYTSVEFTCTYPVDLLSISNIQATDLFGTDPATAANDPQNGSFIFAIAGSNGQKATTDGAAFTFHATGVQEGNASIECTTKIPEGDGLQDLESAGPVTLPITSTNGSVEGTVEALKSISIELYSADGNLFTTVSADANGYFRIDSVPAGLYSVEAKSSGHLSARGENIEIRADETTTMQLVALLAGDVDGDNDIDQFDATTIGSNYNSATPESADLNSDSIINVLDLEILPANYTATGPLLWAIATP